MLRASRDSKGFQGSVMRALSGLSEIGSLPFHAFYRFSACPYSTDLLRTMAGHRRLQGAARQPGALRSRCRRACIPHTLSGREESEHEKASAPERDLCQSAEAARARDLSDQKQKQRTRRIHRTRCQDQRWAPGRSSGPVAAVVGHGIVPCAICKAARPTRAQTCIRGRERAQTHTRTCTQGIQNAPTMSDKATRHC